MHCINIFTWHIIILADLSTDCDFVELSTETQEMPCDYWGLVSEETNLSKTRIQKSFVSTATHPKQTKKLEEIFF